jgi:hypothetical protein
MTGTAEVLNVPRALMASFDLSAPFRQGVLMVGRPKQWIPAFKDMFKYFGSEGAYQNMLNEVKSRPTASLMREANLAITSPSKILTNREEAFMSNLAEKIPVIGKVVKASDRAYSGFLTKLRADVFDDILKKAQDSGLKVTPKMIDSLGNFVNTATGRGKLPSVFGLDKAAVALNTAFFSPKLAMSRIQTLNPGYYVKLDPFVRKEALKSLFSFAGIALSVLGLAKLAGADVNVDQPNNSDWGKIKIGNTRYDILGGMQQYIRLAAQLITGKIISSTTGVSMTLGEGYKPMTKKDILQRFVESKEAPVMTFVNGLLTGTDQTGKPFNVPKEIASRFIPLIIQDLNDLIKNGGIKDIPKDIPGIFGVGVQTYVQTPDQVVSSANSVNNEIGKLTQSGDIEGAKKLRIQNADIIRMGNAMGPLQSTLNGIENQKKTIKDNKRLTDQQKKDELQKMNDREKVIQDRLNIMFKQLQSSGPIMQPR